jgi:exosortase/archaeosortase family protein
MSKKLEKRKLARAKEKERPEKKEAFKKFLKHLIPLISAVGLWIITLVILHLPSIKQSAHDFFVKFTLDSSVLFGKLLFLPVESNSFPFITVSGYTMKVIMECTAYNFYIFVIFLSLLAPVKWKQKLITLVIFLLAIFIVNNLRFITMGYIGKYNADMFHYVHDYLWNILFGIMVFLIWMWRYKKNWSKEKESVMSSPAYLNKVKSRKK